MILARKLNLVTIYILYTILGVRLKTYSIPSNMSSSDESNANKPPSDVCLEMDSVCPVVCQFTVCTAVQTRSYGFYKLENVLDKICSN